MIKGWEMAENEFERADFIKDMAKYIANGGKRTAIGREYAYPRALVLAEVIGSKLAARLEGSAAIERQTWAERTGSSGGS